MWKEERSGEVYATLSVPAPLDLISPVFLPLLSEAVGVDRIKAEIIDKVHARQGSKYLFGLSLTTFTLQIGGVAITPAMFTSVCPAPTRVPAYDRNTIIIFRVKWIHG